MKYSVSVTPLTERKAKINQSQEVSTTYGPALFDFRGDTFTPKTIKLPIDLPVYRTANCRTFSKQQTIISRRSLSNAYFENGQESTEVQQVQHDILVELSNQGSQSVTPIYKVLEEEGQREPLLITITGVVVNGNRRIAAMRDLLIQNDGTNYKHFSYVHCAVLPADISVDEIDDIEAELQARRSTKLDYDWIGDAQLLQRQLSKGRTTKQVADRLRRNKKDVEETLNSLDEADLYLSEWIHKPKEYDLVQSGQQIFGDLTKAVKNKDPNLQNASRAIAWALFKERNKVPGRVYRLNQAFGDLTPKVMELLGERLDLPNITEIDGISEDEFTIEIDSNKNTNDYTQIIQALRGQYESDSIDSSEIIDILVDACESSIELNKGELNENAALRMISRIHSKLLEVDVNKAGIHTLPGILKQIASIQKCLITIENKVKTIQSDASAVTERK